MIDLKQYEIWFVTGSQDLYGEETLRKVAEHSQQIARSFNEDKQIPVRVVFKPTVKSTEEIYSVCQEANNGKELYRHNRLDAYLFPCKNVDRRIKNFAEAVIAPAYTI